MSIKEVGLPSSRRAALCMTRDLIHLLLGVYKRICGKLAGKSSLAVGGLKQPS